MPTKDFLKDRLNQGVQRLPIFSTEDLSLLRKDAGLDLLVRKGARSTPLAPDIAGGLVLPTALRMKAARAGSRSRRGPGSSEPPEVARAASWLGSSCPGRPPTAWFALKSATRRPSRSTPSRRPLETLPQRTFLFLTLLFLFAAVWVGLALSRTISEPVRALAKAAQRVGTGDLDVSLSEHGRRRAGLPGPQFQHHDPGSQDRAARPSRPRRSASRATGSTWVSSWKPCPWGS